MLHHVEQPLGMARWEMLPPILPAATEFAYVFLMAQGFGRTAQDSADLSGVELALVETDMQPQRHHGVLVCTATLRTTRIFCASSCTWGSIRASPTSSTASRGNSCCCRGALGRTSQRERRQTPACSIR